MSCVLAVLVEIKLRNVLLEETKKGWMAELWC